jgi:hypothetical protein
MIIDNLDSLPDQFKEGVRGILLIRRNKDGESGNAQRKAIKKISRNKEEWKEIILNFKELQKNSYEGYRIYSSVNGRNMDKAIHEFKLRQISSDYGNKEELDWFYVDVENRFFSCLMNPSCRTESNFLVDCDTPQEYQKAIDRIEPQLILLDYETKNGRHLITKPFNPNEIKVEAKKDELIFIG